MKTFQEFINESVIADANRASDHALRLSMVAARSDGRADHHAAAKAHVAAAKANKLASEHADTAANMRSHFATNAFEHKVTGRNHTSSKMSASNESVTSFNDFLAEADVVKRETYSWGNILKVEKPGKFGTVLHAPEQHKLGSLEDGQTHKFKDESNQSWHAHREGDTIHLKHAHQGYKLSFDRKHVSGDAA